MIFPYFLCFVSLVAVVRSDFYVSNKGNDGARGTLKSPFKSLQRAQKAVREALPNMKSDVHVFVGPGVYQVSEPLHFTDEDSGRNGHQVVWQAQDMARGANISGGIELTGWTRSHLGNGIYTASVPRGLQSRHLYANQEHLQLAHKSLNRTWIQNTTEGFDVLNDEAEFLKTMPGLEKAEIFASGSWTTRLSPIKGVSGNGSILMEQPAWNNNNIGYDTISSPFHDHGLYVQNALALLDEENEWYLDSDRGTVYFKPPDGCDINSMYIVLAHLEELLIISGTYDDPVHDLTFRGFNYMHTTWNLPSSGLGYVDQQTGAFIGYNKTYTEFEASRPFWWQVPGSIQVSAAKNLLLQNGSIVALFGGIGIGNNAQAHASGIGLGADGIEISGMYLHQTGINAITIGGVMADAHHPTDPRLINKNNRILENIFSEIGMTFSDSSTILVTYAENTQIVSNDICDVHYSGMCYGWGWGSNDAGGSEEYANRGLYKYQPRYTTPTTMKGGRIAKNLIHRYGNEHFDLGGIYTLSDSPNTTITENWIFDPSEGTGLYHDEGSRSYVTMDMVIELSDWLWRNENTNYTTGNLTLINVAVQGLEDATNEWGDRIVNQTLFSSYSDLSSEFKNVVLSAGIPQGSRSGRPVSVTEYPF